MLVVLDVVEIGVFEIVVAARGWRDVEALRSLRFVEVVGLLAVDSEAFESELAFRHGWLIWGNWGFETLEFGEINPNWCVCFGFTGQIVEKNSLVTPHGSV